MDGPMTPRHAPRRTALAAAVACAAVVVGSAAGAGTPDQSQPAIGNGQAFVSSQVSTAQTFTSGLTGRLDQVDLAVSRAGAPTTLPLTVEVRTTAGGVPGSTVLATSAIPGASIPLGSTPVFISVPLAAPPAVTAGVQYAIVLSSATCGFINCFHWGFPPGGNPYAGGAALQSLNGGAWVSQGFLTNSDLAFKTYVAEQPTSKAWCKKGGWKGFTNPRFKNQGQCVAYVNHHSGKAKAKASAPPGASKGKGKDKKPK